MTGNEGRDSEDGGEPPSHEEGHLDEEKSSPSHDEWAPPQGVRKAATDPILSYSSQTYPWTDATTNPSQPSDSTPYPRVRFSQDLERTLGNTNVQDGGRNAASPAPATGIAPSIRSKSVTEPHSTLRSSLPSRAVSAGARGRNRGYSLRRSLFAKNMDSQAEEHGRVIEMKRPGSSYPLINTVHSDSSKEKQHHTDDEIIVSATLKDDDSGSPPRSIASVTKPHSFSSHRARRRASSSAVLAALSAYYQKARKTILGIHEIPPGKDGRIIELDATRKYALIDERTGHSYIGNTIRSSRFTLWNFLPRQLFAQFSKLANFYFLCVSILQMIPGLSTTGTYTTIIPLMIFVGISMAKEGYDDVRRWRLDKEENNRDARVLHAYRSMSTPIETNAEAAFSNPKQWAMLKWKDIQVGDIVRLDRDDPAPADLLLLHAQSDSKIAYVETMALDGETNLKSKQPPSSLTERCQSLNELARCRACVTVEDPNLNLYSFEGRVSVGEETLPLTNQEIIYRGSILRNTKEAFGLVIYTGEECKIRMNANKNPRIKAPSLQAVVNRVVLLIVCIVISLAIFNTVAYHIWSKDTEDKSWYLNQAAVPISQIFVGYIIMFNTMVPLSLYVSLEIVKVCQMFLLNDVDMYDEASNTPIEARTSTINEELGQVSYIFSDKTGTLTNNSMRFRKMSVAGTAWLHDPDLQEEAQREGHKERLVHKKRSVKGKGVLPRKSNLSSVKNTPRKSNVSFSADRHARPALDRNQSDTSVWRSSTGLGGLHYGGKTGDMLAYIQRRPHTVFAKRARFLLLSLALCHTCLPEKDEDGEYSFQAASPDELALVTAAQELGYVMVSRDSNTITIRSDPTDEDDEPLYETYEVLDVIEFSSARKRMSIIVRLPDQRICVFCKGADSTLMGLLRLSDLATSKVAEIERRANHRKGMEASQALRRRSTMLSQSDTGARASLGLGRTSLGSLSERRQSTLDRKSSIRQSIDIWLSDRASDFASASKDDNSRYYTPRPSAHFRTPRASLVFGDGRQSFQTDHEDALVEEALVLNDSAVFERCFQHINDFATEGLRTLLYGYRYVTDEEYAKWKQLYLEATTSLVDRQSMIEETAEMIENQFELVGATAIEDQLQKGVPETIDKLRRANIKLWMLTGDKRETAINIGQSCRLVKDYSTVTIVDHETGEVDQRMVSAIVEINRGTVAHSVVVVDGQTLAIIEAQETVYNLFIDLAILADSVICCRASPSQKASLVEAIRRRVKHSITLAIGDGANDIAMIQEAHVGIGITGKEGLQAARTSDYSIAQFRFLLKLLLVHGHWNYIRVCKYTLGTFWKEMLFYLTQALYQRWTGYTGTSLYESWSLSMFNTLFTSLPVIFMGVFEKDLAASTLLAMPELYTKGQRNGGFNIKLYLCWAFMSTCEAVAIFFIMFGIFGDTLFTKDNGLYAMGALTFTACVIVISTKMQVLEMHNKSITAIIAIILSVGGWFLWNILLSVLYADNNIYNVKDGILERFGQNLLWWSVLLLTVTIVVIWEITVTTSRTVLFPTDTDVFQGFEQDREIRKRFEEAAADELQQGWDRGTKKSSLELAREAEAEVTREAQVQELLDRPRVMEEGRSTGQVRRRHSGIDVDDAIVAHVTHGGATPPERSLDIQELFAKGFGSVRKGPELK